MLVLHIELLEMLQSFSGVKTLGAGERTHTDLIALSKFHISSDFLKSFILELVS